MKRITVTVFVVCLVVGASAQGLSKETRLEVASANEWRGTVLTDGLVFQPQIEFGLPTGTQLRVWGSFDLENEGINEMQLFLRHNFALGLASATVGAIRYQREGGLPDTTELYGSVSTVLPMPLTFSVWQDIDQVDGLYARVGTGAKIPFIGVPGTKMDASWRAWLGYSDDEHAAYYGAADAGLADLGGRVTVGFGVGKAWIAPWLQYTTLIDSDFSSANGHRSNVTIGVAFGTGF